MSVAVADAAGRRHRVAPLRRAPAAARHLAGGSRGAVVLASLLADLDARAALQHRAWSRSKPKGDVFTDTIWPEQPSLDSFWVVMTQGYWYLEHFWHQFGNSFYIGVGDRRS